MEDVRALERFLLGPSRTVALPSRTAPRLLAATDGPGDRWRTTALYPAFRLPARLARHGMRIAAGLGAFQTRRDACDDAELRRFLRDRVPDPTATVVLAGTAGPAQKTVVQVWHGTRVVAYLKYAEKPSARMRLECERHVLDGLPAGVGPSVLAAGPLFDGIALLLSAMPGRRAHASFRLSRGAAALLSRLAGSGELALDRHPWLRHLAAQGREVPVSRWLGRLDARRWPVVHQHGDFVAWNLVTADDGRVRAVDWEYGRLHGFPHLDAAHYLLQTGLLVRRWAPAKAVERAARELAATQELAPAEADALVRIAAYEAYLEADRDGVDTEQPLQRSRRAAFAAAPIA